MAAAASCRHMSGSGASERHTSGRVGWPNSRQRWWASSWMQRTPAGLPEGMPGIGDEIEGAMQHAPQPGRQSMADCLCRLRPAADRDVWRVLA
jgi:hypothetical protein